MDMQEDLPSAGSGRMARSQCASWLQIVELNEKVPIVCASEVSNWCVVHPYRWIVCVVHRPSETKVTRAPGCGRAPPFPE